MPTAPTLSVRVTSTAPELSRELRRFVRSQLPFATAKALTRVAQLARDEQREAMEDRFTIRSRRVIRGITIERAEKADWPRPAARVGTRDAFIARHEAGGIQRSVRGGRRIAVPTRAVERRRTKTGRIPKSLKPRQLLRARRAYLTPGGEIVLKRKRKRTMGGLRTAFTLHRAIRLRPRLELEATVRHVAETHYGRVFGRELREAALSAKARAERAAARARARS